MSAKTITISPETFTEQSEQRKLGTQVIHFPEGPALCTDACSITSITAEDSVTREQFIVIAMVTDWGEQRIGGLAPMTPNHARNFAASLIKAANGIDQRGGLS